MTEWYISHEMFVLGIHPDAIQKNDVSPRSDYKYSGFISVERGLEKKFSHIPIINIIIGLRRDDDVVVTHDIMDVEWQTRCVNQQS